MTAEPRLDRVSIQFLDVGQGHATIITDHESGLSLLIDCPQGMDSVASKALSSAECELDLAIVTHMDADHYGGMYPILVKNPSGKLFLEPPVTDRRSNEMHFLRAVLALHEKRDNALIDDSVSGSMGRVSWRIVAPRSVTKLRARSANSNNRSSILVEILISPKHTGQQRRLLVVGDAEIANLVEYHADLGVLQCDFLLWPHHGARLSGAIAKEEWFLSQTDPAVVVLSAGSHNPYSHPAREVVHAVAASPARVLCTEVTPRCHPSLVSEPTPCAGTVHITVAADGAYDVVPSEITHSARVDTWMSPICRLREDLSPNH